jgi:hypothetical protein
MGGPHNTFERITIYHEAEKSNTPLAGLPSARIRLSQIKPIFRDFSMRHLLLGG